MSEPEPPVYLDALRALCEGLAALGAPWTLLGGAAVISLGVPRYTSDIDATLLGGGRDLEETLRGLGRHGIVPRIDDAVGFAGESHVLLLIHEPSQVPIDLSLAWLPFEEDAISASRPVRFGPLSVPVPRPEDLVIYKLIASRPRDLEDAERLLLLHAATIDLARVRSILEEVCDALEDSSRLDAWDQLLEAAKIR